MSSNTGPDLFAADFKADPYPVYERLRQHSPVRPVDTPRGRMWLVTRYADARQALTDPRLVKRPPRREDFADPQERVLNEHMLSFDPPEHTRLRRLVSKVFTAGRIEGLRPRVREIAESLVTPLVGAPGERRRADLVADFAFPLPITVICEMLGVPRADQDSFRSWSNTIVSGMAAGGSFDAMRALSGYIVDLIADKRGSLGSNDRADRRSTRPGERSDDLLSDLIAVRDDNDGLTERELVSMVFLLLIAGHETTVNLIANGMHLLLAHPDQYRRLRSDPSLIPTAVEEFLRYESPVETTTPRFTASPVEVGGVTIPAGEVVLVALSSANRDEERFAEPARFDVARGESSHLAFGHGIHFCLGAPLARMEGQVAFETLLARLPELALAVPADALAWRPGILIRGLVDLPVEWVAGADVPQAPGPPVGAVPDRANEQPGPVTPAAL
jgi:cytochrome P450